MKKKFENFLNYIIENKKCFLIVTLFFIFFDYYTHGIFFGENLETNFIIGLLFNYFYYFVNILFLILVYYFYKKQNLKPEKKYVIIAAVFGFLYLFFIPVLSGTDEPAHFYRAYQISEGEIISEYPYRTKIPSNLQDLSFNSIKNNYKLKKIFEPMSKELVEVTTKNATAPIATSYSPIQYVPQVLGILVSKLFNFGPILMVLTARFFSFTAWLFITYYAVKFFPYKKHFIIILLLSPAVLSLVSTSSGDTFSTALGFLFISYVLKLYDEKRPITNNEKILLLLSAIGLTAFKNVYGLILSILFILPKECFNNSKKSKIVNIFIVLIIGLIICISWYILSNKGVPASDNAAIITAQTDYIKEHPIKFFEIIIYTCFNRMFYYLTNIVAGKEMCFGTPVISEVFCIAYFLLLCLSYFYNDKLCKLKVFSKTLFLGIFLVIFLGVNYVMYTGWTSIIYGVKYPIVMGVQSRYFLLLIPLLSLIPKISNKINFKNEKFIFNSCIFLNCIILIETISSLFVFWLNVKF